MPSLTLRHPWRSGLPVGALAAHAGSVRESEPSMPEIKTYRVPVSFFVKAASPEEAERIALTEINSAPVQRLISESVRQGEIFEPARTLAEDPEDW